MKSKPIMLFRSQRLIAVLRYLTLGLAILALIQGVNTAFAQDTAQTKQQPAMPTMAKQELTYAPWYITANAADWGLDDEEWLRYQSLMRGEAGLHYAHMEPLFILGMYAENEVDKQRYAERYAQMDADRLDRYFEFDRAYKDARAKLYPGAKRINPAMLAKRKAILDSPLYSLKKPRLSIYLTDDCKPCDVIINSLVLKDREMDLFFVDVDSESRIQAWAKKLNLPFTKVESNRITLNFDDGWYATYGTGEFPGIYENGESGFTPVALEAIQ